MKKASVINDLSGMGRCSLTAAIPVLSALGVQCVPLPTAVLTGQTGYPFFHCTDLTDMMPLYIEAWKENHVHFDAIYSGYTTGYAQIIHVLNFIDAFYAGDTLLLVDPVMGDDGRTYGMFSSELLDGMRQLSRRADLITPNLTEACLLTGTDTDRVFSNADDGELLEMASEIALKLREQATHPQDIIITGIKCRKNIPAIYNIAIGEGISHEPYISSSPLIDCSFSGTGDLFASAICGLRLQGISLRESIEITQRFLYDSIVDTLRETPCPDSNDGIHFENHLMELWEHLPI